jgi:isoquinoline 1-oxidoreductase beta subunit
MAFVYQSFMDEVAEAAGIDLPELRRTLGAPRELPVVPGRPIMHSGRARVIDGVCKMANWQGGKLAPGAKGESAGAALASTSVIAAISPKWSISP